MSSKAASDNHIHVPAWVNFSTAGMGGCLAWVAIHPFNTVAVRSNLSSASGKPFSVRTMISTHGVSSLYDGLAAGILRQVVYATTRFGLFETCRDALHDARGKTDFVGRVVVGAGTGGIAAYLSCPMEVSVVRMSNDSSLPAAERRNYKGVWDCASRIVKEEGVAAFWRGSTPFVQRAMVVGVFQVATYDQFKDLFASQLHQHNGSVPNVFCAAMTSGLLYSLVTMPLEAAKNRMASQKKCKESGALPYKSTMQTIQKVAKEEGFRSLYKGYAPYYLRCGGHTVSMFILVQILRDLYTGEALWDE